MDRQLVHPTTVPATFFGLPLFVLAGFNLERLFQVGCKVRDIFQQYAKAPEWIAAACDGSYTTP